VSPLCLPRNDFFTGHVYHATGTRTDTDTDTHMRSPKNPRGRSSWDDLVHSSARATSGYSMVGRPRTTYHSYECVENNNNDDGDDNTLGVYRKDGMYSVRIVIRYSDFCIHIIIYNIFISCVCVINILHTRTKRALEIEPVPRRISIGLSNYIWLPWVTVWDLFICAYTSTTLHIIKFRKCLVYHYFMKQYFAQL